MLKIAAGMIVFNGDFVLKQCLESIYPFVSQILVSEGPVTYWQKKGFYTSTDRTNEILNSFPDPENKITIVHGQFLEKDDQCKAYMSYLKEDMDYIWNVDSDEIYKYEDIENIIKMLQDHKYTSVGIRSCSFYGGFDHYIGGFEEERDQFLRIFKVYPGSTWMNHRPPKIIHDVSKAGKVLDPKHMDSDTLYDQYGIKMFHYSAVFPRQVYNKQSYYRTLANGKFIDDYFNRVYIPWIRGTVEERLGIEQMFQGVHEYKPEYRRPSFTKPFNGVHPLAIQNVLPDFKEEIKRQLGYSV